VVFAVPKLEQPVGCHRPIAAGRGAIQTDLLRIQVVHPQQVPVQRGLKTLPGRILAEGAQHIPQAIIAEIQGAHRLSGAATQCLQALLRPGLDVAQPVVAFRKDMGQPNRSRPPQAEALPVAMGREVLVQQRRYAHPFHLGQE
jgi:hypothetical protein